MDLVLQKPAVTKNKFKLIKVNCRSQVNKLQIHYINDFVFLNKKLELSKLLLLHLYYIKYVLK